MSLQHFKKKFAKKTKFACATTLFVINARFHPKFLIGKSVDHKKGCGAWKLSLYSSFLSKTLHIWCKEAIKLVLSEIHEMTSYRPPLIILIQQPPCPWIHLLILILSRSHLSSELFEFISSLTNISHHITRGVCSVTKLVVRTSHSSKYH